MIEILMILGLLSRVTIIIHELIVIYEINRARRKNRSKKSLISFT